jgi:glutathione S-transferase|tara:strand:+ start:391 stop:1011 length:621 start_codon:yes stop_codon:yes gene_type:complete
MEPKMKLYYSPGACSLSPHIILREVGAEFELDLVDLQTKKTQSGDDYLGICLKGYVPALALDTGDVITEGVAIIQYIADGVPEADLIPPSGSIERAKLQGVLNFISAELHKSFSPLFSATASEEQIQAAPDKVGKCFDYIEARFSDGRTHIMGDTYTIADAYLFVVARWAGFKDISLDAWPKLQAYLQRIGDRPAVKAAIEAEASG